MNFVQSWFQKAGSGLSGVYGKLGALVLGLGVSGLASAAALDDAIAALIDGVMEGITTVVTSVVPLLVLVFGFAFAIRWTMKAIKS
jgi:hypothetical protein